MIVITNNTENHVQQYNARTGAGASWENSSERPMAHPDRCEANHRMSFPFGLERNSGRLRSASRHPFFRAVKRLRPGVGLRRACGSERGEVLRRRPWCRVALAGTTGRARFAGAPGAGLLVLREALASASRLCSARRRGGHRGAASKRWRHSSARCSSRVARNEMGGAMVSQSSFRDICNDLKCINEQ